MRHADECSVLYGISNCNLSKLQRTPNFLSRTVLNVQPSATAFVLTRLLFHWLLMKQLQIGLLGFRAKHLLLPPYLLELLSDYQLARQLRLSYAPPFSKPAVTLYFGSCAFSTAVTSVWISLEPDLRSAASLASFKSC